MPELSLQLWMMTSWVEGVSVIGLTCRILSDIIPSAFDAVTLLKDKVITRMKMEEDMSKSNQKCGRGMDRFNEIDF